MMGEMVVLQILWRGTTTACHPSKENIEHLLHSALHEDHAQQCNMQTSCTKKISWRKFGHWNGESWCGQNLAQILKFHGEIRYNFVVPNFAIPNCACSKFCLFQIPPTPRYPSCSGMRLPNPVTPPTTPPALGLPTHRCGRTSVTACLRVAKCRATQFWDQVGIVENAPLGGTPGLPQSQRLGASSAQTHSPMTAAAPIPQPIKPAHRRVKCPADSHPLPRLLHGTVHTRAVLYGKKKTVPVHGCFKNDRV